MDGDVSRKDKPVHCGCDLTLCPDRESLNLLYCDITKCPVALPCNSHGASITGYMEHLKGLISSKLIDTDNTCIVVPCDSLEAWVVAAFDGPENVEHIEDPWRQVILKGVPYHGVRIPRQKKSAKVFREFAPVVC